MNAIHPIAQTDDTVTLRRADFEMMLEAVEDAEDIMALGAAEAREKEVGKEAARADHLPVELVMRLMAGEHPVRVWRDHRSLSPQALADKAGVARSYLVEIEGHKKPGSVAAYRRLANALGVAVDDLLPPEDDGRTEH
jgi:DNA-binding XRE family transcriptional regulator